MNNEDKAADEMANLVLDVYRYALDNNVDITSHNDVKQILTDLKLDSDNIDIETLIQGLVALDRMTKADMAKRGKLAN